MGEAFITRRGGGVAGLNFRVIDGTARPSNPKENDIWVNTGIKVSGYYFAAEMPFLRSNNKNKIVYPFYHTTKTEDGITWTDNGDGSITVNGTATGNALFRVSAFESAADHEYLEAGTYTLSGCPAGGSDSTYLTELFILNPATNTNEAIGRDYGEGFTFTLERDCKVRVNLNVMSGTTVNGIVFKPQIEKGSAATAFVKGDATGQVWISNGTSSGVEFNALKKNSLFVYPVVVWQYKYGKWSTEHAEIFKNGQWVQFSSVFSATIAITYPAGSTCTCSDGVTTLTAPDTSGVWECIVSNAGTWTVSCTDGTDSTDEVVEITTDGQRESIELSYIYYIVKDGKLVVDVMANGKRTETDNYLEFVGTGSGWFQMFHKVNLTKYDRVEIKGEFITTSNFCLLCVWNENVQPQSSSALASISSVQLGNDKPLSVNALTGLHCVGVQTEYTRVQKIKDLYLVPIGG